MKTHLLLAFLIFSGEVFSTEVTTKDFSISAPEFGTDSAGQIVHIFLPPEQGFAPNVNVQKQHYSGTLVEYKNLSDSQFSHMKLKVLKSEIKNKKLIFEYTTTKGRNLHFYSVAYKQGDFIFLATATCPVESWNSHKSKLVKSVNGLILKPQ